MKGDREKLAISPLNGDPDIKAQVRAKSVTICDVTLRDGELAVPGGFRLEDYLIIAHLLDDSGVPLLQICYPGVYAEHKAAAIALRKERLNAKLEVKVQGTAPNWKKQIDDCLQTGADQISLQFSGAAPRHQRIRNPNWTAESHIAAMQEAVRYGSERGGKMEVTATDGSRGELPFLLDYYKAAVAAGAVAVRLNESVPAMSPIAFKYLVTQIKKVVPIPLGVHCHNNWGLALANACAAVEGGAEVVDACVNGLAGHSGNVALDEAVLTFKYLYGFEIPIRTELFMKLSQVVEGISGQKMASNKAVVGRNVYAHSGHHGAHSVIADPTISEPFPPELVGNERRFPLQWDTTDPVVRFNLERLSIETEDLDVSAVVEEVRRFAKRNRREMEADEFSELVERLRSEPPARHAASR